MNILKELEKFHREWGYIKTRIVFINRSIALYDIAIKKLDRQLAINEEQQRLTKEVIELLNSKNVGKIKQRKV